MKVILLQDIAKIGKKFDIKEISNGYALNFLLPQKLAKMATKETIKELEGQKKKYEETRKIEQEEIRKGIEKMKDKPIEIKVKTNKAGKLFAKIDKKEIREAIKKQTGVCIRPDTLELEKPIKETGEYKIKYKIKIEEGEIKTELTLNIIEEEK